MVVSKGSRGKCRLCDSNDFFANKNRQIFAKDKGTTGICKDSEWIRCSRGGLPGS